MPNPVYLLAKSHRWRPVYHWNPVLVSLGKWPINITLVSVVSTHTWWHMEEGIGHLGRDMHIIWRQDPDNGLPHIMRQMRPPIADEKFQVTFLNKVCLCNQTGDRLFPSHRIHDEESISMSWQRHEIVCTMLWRDYVAAIWYYCRIK